MKNISVLIIEDEGIVAKDIANSLQELGYTVAGVAATGRDAIAKAQATRPDIVLMDIVLKGPMDGIAAAEVIRQEHNVPIIYLTAYADDQTLARVKATQPYGYVVKPFEARELNAVIQTALNRYALEREIEKSREWLTTIFNALKEAIVSTDEQLKTRYLNRTAEALTAWSQPDALDQLVTEVVRLSPPPWGGEGHPAVVALQTRTEEPFAPDCWLMDRNGEKHPVEGTASPILHEDSLRGTVTVFRDITERKQVETMLRESEGRYQTLVASAPFSIWICDEEGTITFANQAALELFGVSDPSQIIGRYNIYRDTTEAEKPLLAHFERAYAGEVVRYRHDLDMTTVRYETRHRDAVHISSMVFPMSVGGGHRPHLVVVQEDVTERVQAREALRRRLAELEALHNVSAALRPAQTLDEILPVLLDETLAAIQSEAGVIWLYHPENDELRVAVARGWFERLNESSMKPGEGIVGTVFVSGQAHFSRKFASDPLVLPSEVESIPSGWGGICVPIRTDAEVVGVLFVSVSLPREIAPEESKLLASLAEIAGTVLHRLHLHEETLRRLKDTQALQTVDRAIATSLDLRVTLDVLLEQVTARLGVDATGVLLFSAQLLTLEYVAGRGFRTQPYEHSRLRLGEGLAGRAALEQRLLQAANVLESPDFARAALLHSEGFKAYIAMPLVAKGQLKGVLEIFHRMPLQPDAEWLEFLKTLAGQAAIAIDNIQLFVGLQRSNADLALAYDTTIEGWSRALDLRDKETEGHTQRVAEMTVKLTRAMEISEAELVHVRYGALLHDIGKMGIPDSILLKRGKLTPEEWEIMRQHPKYSYDMLAPIAYLRPALDIPYCHHEKWDGTGYPRGLKGEEIPFAARIFSVADVWDALTSNRPYRDAWTEEQTLEYIRKESGRHFDPRVVEAFLKLVGITI